jgi:hypothetical protein
MAMTRQIKGNNATTTPMQKVDEGCPQAGVIFPAMHQEHRRDLITVPKQMPTGNLGTFLPDHVVICLMEKWADTWNRSPLWLAGLVQKVLGIGHNVVHDRACGTLLHSLQGPDETETS